jgi:hypothetical protein
VDLVDKEDVAILKVGEQGGEIARFGDHRPRCRPESHPHLARDDLGQRRLAKPGRPEEQHMIEGVAARPRRLDEHAQILARRLLPDEFVERLGAERGVDIFGPAAGCQDAVVLAHRRQA